jgi:hypothetical protein
LAAKRAPGEILAPNWQRKLALGNFSRSFRGQDRSWRRRLSIFLLENFVKRNRLSVFEAKMDKKIPPSQLWRPNAGDFVPGSGLAAKSARNMSGVRFGRQEGLKIQPEPALAAKRDGMTADEAEEAALEVGEDIDRT